MRGSSAPKMRAATAASAASASWAAACGRGRSSGLHVFAWARSRLNAPIDSGFAGSSGSASAVRWLSPAVPRTSARCSRALGPTSGARALAGLRAARRAASPIHAHFALGVEGAGWTARRPLRPFRTSTFEPQGRRAHRAPDAALRHDPLAQRDSSSSRPVGLSCPTTDH